MTIFFDHQTFSLQNYGGISRYYAELMSGINRYSEHTAYLPPLYSNNVYLKDKEFSVKPFFPNQPFEKREALVYRLNKYQTLPLIYTKKYDIFHATYYDPYFVNYIHGRPFVITFLDMIHEKFSTKYQELALDKIITARKLSIAQKADRIIAISQSTKRDIVDLFNIKPEKIEVIYLGSSLSPKPNQYPDITTTDNPYLLYVGHRHHYKNFLGLLAAIHPLLKRYKLKLVCAGGGHFTKEEYEFIRSLGVEAAVEQKPINDDVLTKLYQHAVAFIFPSYYEGFGIPVLEAFACDCPCIISNSSSLPEVAGEAALYIDPAQPDSMVDAVTKLIVDSTLRETLILRGREQLAKFSWQKTVKETVSLYETILSDRNA